MSGSRLLAAPTSGLRLWYAVFAGIGWWMLHLTVVSATAELRCDHPGAVTVIHFVTVVTALLTLQATWWCVQLVRKTTPGDDEDGGPRGRWLFLGWFGALSGAVSLVLIAYEGTWVPFITTCG